MDAISYSYADKQAKRIKKFIENPDSNSGIITVPKTIEAGESVTIPTGRMAVLPNIQVDGTLNIEGEVFIPSGSSVDFSTGIKVNGEKLTMSIHTAYHIYNGSVEATDTTNLSINALVPYANGIDINGSKVSIEYKNETITGLTLTQGKNYVYSKNDGTYGVSSTAPSYGTDNPLAGDFFNLNTLKWYDSSNAEITPRTYLDCIVHADHNGQISYVEELPKTTYFDEVKANEFKGKNACTAWVLCNGLTTPPTILDSFNVSKVIRNSPGVFKIVTENDYDNLDYSVFCTVNNADTSQTTTSALCISGGSAEPKTKNSFTIATRVSVGSEYDQLGNYIFSVQIFGGK